MAHRRRLARLVQHVVPLQQQAAAAAAAAVYPPVEIGEEHDAGEKVRYIKRGHVAYVIINRPERLNACDYETYARLSEVWYDFDHDTELRVAILTGTGIRAFCAGSDIKSNYNEEFQSGDGKRSYGKNVRRELPQLSLMAGAVTKPVICAINGHANGGGMEQALACDIRVAADHAMFGLGEVRLGWLPGGGATQRLPRLISQGRALEMLMTGNRMGAGEAHRLGIVDHVVPLEGLLAKCESIAHEICLSAPLAVRKIKEVALAGLDKPLAEGLRLEHEGYRWLNTTADAKEGAAAFAAKRAPNWKAK